jgi:tetratricopeptide (TPR) repeat protein
MKSDSIAYVVAGMCFGIILGWVIGTQQAKSAAVVPVAAAPAAAASQAAAPAQRQPPPLDEARVSALTATITANPKDAVSMVQLGNVYFDAEKFDESITWYQSALAIDPANADASTDLGVSYFYTDRPDHALAQFERSLKIDPRHTKTMLNKGIVLAFGKQDIRGASEEWKKVMTLAPDSAEGQAARKMLEGIANAPHAGEPASTNQ